MTKPSKETFRISENSPLASRYKALREKISEAIVAFLDECYAANDVTLPNAYDIILNGLIDEIKTLIAFSLLPVAGNGSDLSEAEKLFESAILPTLVESLNIDEIRDTILEYLHDLPLEHDQVH